MTLSTTRSGPLVRSGGRVTKRLLFCGVVVVCFSSALSAGPLGELLLPDIIVRQDDLHEWCIVTNGARTLLRLDNGTANIGPGKLHLEAITAGEGATTQDVEQWIFRENEVDPAVKRLAGNFVYHESHRHVHIEAWAQYRLREILPGNEVGDVIAEGEKTSFCILDLFVYDNTLPNFPDRADFRGCGVRTQGLSVGWLDLYDKNLPGQSIDITDVPQGTYWLESVVDPEDHFLEFNEDNNVERVQVTIGNPTGPDPFEPNDGFNAVDARPAGGFNSPNLGPTNPKRVVEDLTIHVAGNADYFKFYINSTGTLADFVRIDFQNNLGNLDLTLLNSNRISVAESFTDLNTEFIPLEGFSEGWYYVRIVGRGNATSDDYTLTINPPANQKPSIELLSPEQGDEKVAQAFESFVVEWNTSDPEGNLTWVSVFVNQEPKLDGKERLLATSLFTPGDIGFHIVNSADIAPGTYWFFGQVTDGGSTTGTWSSGTVTFVEVPDECTIFGGGEGKDCNGNGIFDVCDTSLEIAPDCNLNAIPDVCDIASGQLPDDDIDGVPDDCRKRFVRGDLTNDGQMDLSDPIQLFNFLFLEGPEPSCLESADVNNDTLLDLNDGVFTLRFLFLRGPPPETPGPLDQRCAPDIDPPGSELDLGCEVYDHCG